MAEIAGLSRPSAEDGADKRVPAAAISPQNSPRAGFAALASIPVEEWRALAERAIEPNGYYLPAWELAVNASAHGRTGVSALSAWSSTTATDGTARLVGLMPAISLWRAYRIPLPALANADPYGTGWLYRLKPAAGSLAAAQLLSAADYQKVLDAEGG